MYLCSKCGVFKEQTEFYARRVKGKGRSAYCRACTNKYSMKRWKERKLQAIAYLGGKCQDCLLCYPLEVYQFHHRDPTQKEFNWAKSRQLSWDKIKMEIDKCDLLCANCHILRHSKDISEYM